jgi:hypothetical protein
MSFSSSSKETTTKYTYIHTYGRKVQLSDNTHYNKTCPINSLPQCRIFRARLFFSWHALLLITIKDLARNENPKPGSMLVTVFGYATQRVHLKDYILGGIPESVR